MHIKQIINKLNSQIKESLEEQGLQQKEYAKHIQLTQSTLSNYIQVQERCRTRCYHKLQVILILI